jgi:hypothetical protein
MDIDTAQAAAQPVAAVDRAEEAREVKRTLVSGILLGVSGGAFIAALQEYMGARRAAAAAAAK